MSGEAPPDKSVTANLLGIVGLVAYAATGILYLASGLLVPGPWIVVLWVIWIAGLYLTVRLFRDARHWTPVVAVAAANFWWLFVTLGENMFGWTP
jgi:hypothetical protein